MEIIIECISAEYCNYESCIDFIDGDDSDLNLSFPMESYVFFEWMFQFEPACIHAYEVDYDDEAALGRLV